VCIKTEGNNPMELDEKGLPYYPLTEEEAEQHHGPRKFTDLSGS